MISIIINSYTEQTYNDIEIIISTVIGDPSIKIANNFNLKCVISESPGIYSQLNKSIKHISGDWYAYASGNDIALPTKLKDELSLCLKYNKKICYSSFYKSSDGGSTKKLIKFHDYDYNAHLKGNFVSDVALINTTILKKYLPFKEIYDNHAYWDLWLRIAENEGNIFVYNSKPEWVYIIDPKSKHIVRNKNKKLYEENKRKRLKMLSDHK